MKIVVYTSITGGKDELIDDQVKGNAEFFAFTENVTGKTWNHITAYDKFKDPRRNSRIQKIMPHQYFDCDYSIYIDGNIKLNVTPETLIEKYLKDFDIAMYQHPNRDCLYEEAKTCMKMGLDDPETIIEQAKMYEDKGYAKHKGLCECGIIIRRHTPKVERFNEAWWAEYTRHSRRDQISCMYAADKVGMRINKIHDFFINVTETKAVKQSGELEIVVHKKNG